MAFDQSGIEARGYREGVSLVVEWTSAAADGTVFQVYLDGSLAWAGTSRRAVLPLPHELAAIDVGAVAAGESATDFSSVLPAVPDDRARLTWSGGAYLDVGGTVSGFNVYSGPTPGAAVDYAAPAGFVAAYGAGLVTGSFGDGTFGGGAFGYPAGTYSWTSGRLATGTWNFGVRPMNGSSNEGATSEVAVAIVAAPRPPAADGSGRRLTVTYNATTGVAMLAWLASPG